MKIGYARVSTIDQKLDSQLKALKNAGCSKIYQEKISGTVRARPELNKLLSSLRTHDLLIVVKVDRIARSTRDFFDIMDTVTTAGAAFRSLSEPWADLTTSTGKLMTTILAGLSAFERDLIHERTSAGRVAAKARGVRFGRPRRLDAEKMAEVRRQLNSGASAVQIARLFDVHVATVYRIVAEP